MWSTDLVGCAGAEEDLGYGRIGMGVGLEVGEGGNISVTDCCPTATPPSLSGCAEAHCSVDFVRHTVWAGARGEGGGQ